MTNLRVRIHRKILKMSAKQQESEDSGEMGDWQLKFLKSLSVVLNEYQRVLPTLPEMCERFISAQANTPKEPHNISNFDLSREDEKTFLEKRKRGDLAKHLKEQLAEKEESIVLLKEEWNEDKKGWDKMLSDKDKDFETFLHAYKTFQQESNSSKEEYVAQLKAKDEELEESRERYQQMQRECQAAISERDENLNKLQHSFHQIEESLNTQIRTKHEELSQVQCSFAQMQESANSIISKKDGELVLMECRQKELKERFKAVLESKDEELKELKIRLAHLSEKLVKKDQRKVEDTVARNRPSEVERDYAEFFDDERLDAIEKMQNAYGSEEVSDIGISYPRLACMIFEAAYEQTKEVKDSALHVFKEVMNIMIEEAPERGERYLFSQKVSECSQELKYPTEVLDAFVLSLKENAHLCSLESVETGVRRKIVEKWLSWLKREESCKFSYSDRLLIHLQEYIQKCIRLTWRMATQVPPMKLEYESTTLKNFHKKVGYHSNSEMCSIPPPNGQASATDEIACYLWPALFDGGGRLIRTGEVLCKGEAEAI